MGGSVSVNGRPGPFASRIVDRSFDVAIHMPPPIDGAVVEGKRKS